MFILNAEGRITMRCFTLFLLATNLGSAVGEHAKPKKIAILGGGAASCSAALALTGQPDWKERYNITIYQFGWRLGGKARSGRNKNYAQRVEEIAGHDIMSTWFNIIRVLRSVYEELNKTEGAPLRTFEEAFISYSFVGNTPPDLDSQKDNECLSLNYLFKKLTETFVVMTRKMMKEMKIEQTELWDEELLKMNSTYLKSKVKLVQKMLKFVFLTVEDNSMKKEQLSMIDSAAAVIIGILDDKLLETGLIAINHLDLRQWLRKHGASQSTLDSGFIQFSYREVAYRKADLVEAGTMLQMMLPIYLCYEVPAFLIQQAGLGDAIFAPIYEVLKKRGVNFKFFHKVEELSLSSINSNFVEQIRMTKQVDLVSEEYDPLINVKGLPSWPNEPKYEEIEQQQADLLQEHHIDLESFWSNWSTVYEENFGHLPPEVILRRGEDFDIIVYGIPVDSLSHLCADLLEKSPSLSATNENIVRIPSLQVQLWGNFDLHDWEDPKEQFQYRLLDPLKEKILYIIYQNDGVVKTEDWKNVKPEHLLYIPFIYNLEEIQDRNYSSFPEEQIEKAKQFAMQNVLRVLENISLNSFQDGVFDWTLLTDPMNRTGVERFDSQYVRLNISPSDRLTQIRTNTSRYRIKTNSAGFDNIYFTGDWIQSGLNYGSIESVVTAGLLTSKAISGYPEEVLGEQFIPK